MNNINEKNEIYKIIKMLKLESLDFNIHDDLSVTFFESVCIDNMNLKHFPLTFNIVEGSFSCVNNRLTTLKGAPKEITGDFNCTSNFITSLKFMPIVLGDDEGINFDNNLVTNFNYLPNNLELNYLSCIKNPIKIEKFVHLIDKHVKHIDYIYTDFNQNGDLQNYLEIINSVKENTILNNTIFKNINNLKYKKL